MTRKAKLKSTGKIIEVCVWIWIIMAIQRGLMYLQKLSITHLSWSYYRKNLIKPPLLSAFLAQFSDAVLRAELDRRACEMSEHKDNENKKSYGVVTATIPQKFQ